jgi:hypothetical protein
MRTRGLKTSFAACDGSTEEADATEELCGNMVLQALMAAISGPTPWMAMTRFRRTSADEPMVTANIFDDAGARSSSWLKCTAG